MGEMLILSKLSSNLSRFKWQVQQSFVEGLSFWRDFSFKTHFFKWRPHNKEADIDENVSQCSLCCAVRTCETGPNYRRWQQERDFAGSASAALWIMSKATFNTVTGQSMYRHTYLRPGSATTLLLRCLAAKNGSFFQELKEWHLFLILHTTTIKKKKMK